MSETSQSRPLKRWRDEFSLSKLDSWISTNKRARWFFRTTPSDSDNSLDTSNFFKDDDNITSEPTERQVDRGTSDARVERQGGQCSTKPRVISVPTIHRKDSIETITPTGPIDDRVNTTMERRKVSPAETHVVGCATSAIPYEGVTISSKVTMMQDGPPCSYKPTCYAITAPQTRCPLPLEHESSRFCRFHSKIKPIHGTLLDRSIFKARDQRYIGKLGTTQCRALSHRKFRCKNISVAKWDLCRVHLKASPHLFVTLSQRGPNTYVRHEGRTNIKPVSHDESELSSTESLSVRKDHRLDVGAGSSLTQSSQTRSSSIWVNSSSSSRSRMLMSYTDKDTSSTSSSSSRESSTLSSHSSATSSSYTTPAEDAFWTEPTEFDHSKDILYSLISKETRCCYISSSGTECPFRTSSHRDSVYCQGHYVLTPRLEYLLRARNDYIPPEATDSDATSASETSEDDGENLHHRDHAQQYPFNRQLSE